MLLNSGFLAFFGVGLVFAAGGCFFWYLIALRLSRSGFQINFFGGPRDTISMFREYNHSASLKGWPKWPVAAFWICGIGMFLAGICSVLAAQTDSMPGFLVTWHTSTIVYRWVALSSLCFAVVFHIAFSSKLPGSARTSTSRTSCSQAMHCAVIFT